jgi:formylglycine-generating enzyme required for sulfatase activity
VCPGGLKECVRELGRCVLPTEAQWERAAKGGDDDFVGRWDGPVVDEGRKELRTVVGGVARTPPNPFGLHDMHDNVWEWCSDLYDPAYYATSARTDPTGPRMSSEAVLDGDWEPFVRDETKVQDDSPQRVLRGGGFGLSFFARACYRFHLPERSDWDALGLRCCVTVGGVPPATR